MSKKYIPIIGLIAFIVIFQLIVSGAGKDFYLTQLTMSAYYALVIIGLSVLMGYAGQLSIGHAAFFAMGGYTTAFLTTYNLQNLGDSPLAKIFVNSGMALTRTDPYGSTIVHVSPWAALFIAVFITIVIAFIIGIPILKLKGHYLAMATLGFGVIIYRIFLGSRIFGEADGISEVPAFNFIGSVSISGDMSLRVLNYYLAWLFVIIGMLLLLNLIDSRVGRALRSIHGSEEASNSMGVDTSRYKLMVFVLSAVYAAVGGVFMTHFNGGIGPSEASIMKSVRYVAIVAVGGMANIWGGLVMGIVLNYLSLRGYFGTYDDVVFGIILIVIMLFYPDGLLLRENFKSAADYVLKIKNRVLTGKNELP